MNLNKKKLKEIKEIIEYLTNQVDEYEIEIQGLVAELARAEKQINELKRELRR